MFSGGADNSWKASKWCIKSGGLYLEQTNLTFLQNEPGKSGSILCLLNIQYLCTKKLIAGRSWPRDVSVCSEGNLATVVSACLATLLGSCHSPPGSLWGSEWGGGWGWGMSSSGHNRLLLLLKTKDYNENMNCLQPLHGVHHLRNVLLLWETPTHDQRSGGCVHVVMIASISFWKASSKHKSILKTYQHFYQRLLFSFLINRVKKQIENRREKLLQLLHLPEEDRQVQGDRLFLSVSEYRQT